MAAKKESALTTSASTEASGVKNPPTREFWSSATAFYFATAGAAIGFGNVWRFPGLSVKYGGGAFFIPYLLAIFFIGIPLTVLELGFGQFFQTGDIGVFGGFHPRLRGVGVCSLACSFMVSSYYIVLIGWVVNAFVSSWDEDAPWGKPGLTGEEAANYFYNDIVGINTVTDSDLMPTRIVGANVGYTALVWILVYLSLFYNLKTTGRITYVTMGLPFVLLFVFLGRAATLPGASDGVYAYIGKWDTSVLKTDTEVWSVACSQVFFSIGLTFGLLTSFGSHCRRDEPVLFNACVIVTLNSMYSVISGFAIFCALGHLAQMASVSILDLPFQSYDLVFGTWPVVLGTLPGGIHWVRLLFFNLFMLGIDSAFAFTEALITVLQDTVIFKDTPRHVLLVGCIVPNFSLSLLYCTDSGLYFMDVIDFYINFVMLLVGFLEAFGAAWACGMPELYKNIGVKPTISYMMANFFPLLIACGFWFDNHDLWIGFIVWVGGWVLGCLVTHVFLMERMVQQPEEWTVGSIWFECAYGNISRLRDQIQPVIGYIPFIWVVLMKNFIPQVLVLLFVNLCASPGGAGTYGGYAIRPYQLLGLLSFIFAIFLFLVGLLVPEIYEPLALPQTKVVLSGVTSLMDAEIENGESKGNQSLVDAKIEDGESKGNHSVVDAEIEDGESKGK
uniref:Transporter n=3 Tax=Pseudo-nitzschia australis TaxID=44445 RepID=A0A7S4AC14_9STRA